MELFDPSGIQAPVNIAEQNSVPFRGCAINSTYFTPIPKLRDTKRDFKNYFFLDSCIAIVLLIRWNWFITAPHSIGGNPFAFLVTLQYFGVFAFFYDGIVLRSQKT